MDITDSIFEDSHGSNGCSDVMLAGELLCSTIPLQYQLPDLHLPDEAAPQRMPVINPQSFREEFIDQEVVSEIGSVRPTAEEIVASYLPRRLVYNYTIKKITANV